MGRKKIYNSDQKFDLKEIMDMSSKLETTIINHLNGDHSDAEKKDHLKMLGKNFIDVGQKLVCASKEM